MRAQSSDTSHPWPVTVRGLPDTFSFTRQWDYPWYIIRHDDGTFENAQNDTLDADDTAHVFNTARVHTSVQGGYDIRYCTAVRTEEEDVVLYFEDGLPAYANTFIVNIKNGRAGATPDLASPGLPSAKNSWTVTALTVLLNQARYSPGDTVIGHVEMKFTNGPAGTQSHTLSGWFRTPCCTPDP